MRRVAIALYLLFLAHAPAHAQWYYQGHESAFGDNALHFAVTAAGPYALGLRCKGENIEALYMTPDKSFDTDGYELANLLKPLLRIRVDDHDIIDLDATLVELDGAATIVAKIDLTLVQAVRDAKRRVAVVVQLLNENYHENSFSVRGSTAAVNKLINGCGLH